MPGSRWTEQEVAALQILYPDLTVSREEMEVYFGRSWDTIKSQARQRKIYRRSPRALGSEHWTAEEETLLREMYPDEHIPREEIASKLGRTWKAIQHKIHALGIGLLRARNNTTGVRRDYFRVIDTDEKAYWLGFLAADGCVFIGGRKHNILLGLQARDLHWLTRFRDTVAPGMQISDNPKQKSYSVSIGSQEMVADLIALGITPRKSNTLEWPNVPEELVAPFLLGYFDGDGSLQRRAYLGGYSWTLLGTESFLTTARYYIQLRTGVPMREPVRARKFVSPHLFRIHVYDKNLVILDRWINASGLGLPRKHLSASAY